MPGPLEHALEYDEMTLVADKREVSLFPGQQPAFEARDFGEIIRLLELHCYTP